MYHEWAVDQDTSVVDFVASINEIFREPIVNFDKAYELFNQSCSTRDKANVVGDHWRVFQMMVYTEMDETREKIFGDFISMVKRIMGDSPGGQQLYLRKLESGNVAPTHGPRTVGCGMDYVILLAVRVYIGGIRGVPVPDQSTS